MPENNLPKRKQIRIKAYDYSKDGAYFVTICADKRKSIFGSVIMSARLQAERSPNSYLYLKRFNLQKKPLRKVSQIVPKQ